MIHAMVVTPAVISVAFAVTTAPLPVNGYLARTNASTAAVTVAVISLHALIRHQYHRKISTAPHPAPRPSTISHPSQIEPTSLATNPPPHTPTTLNTFPPP